MSLETIVWLSTAALALEQIERYVMYKRGWSSSYGEPITLRNLLVGIPIVVACGTYCAISAPTSPETALGCAVAILIGVAVFQFLPWLSRGERRYVPGLVSELLLLCPLAIAAIWLSLTEGRLSAHGLVLIVGPLIGCLLGTWWAVRKPSMPPMPPGPFGD